MKDNKLIYLPLCSIVCLLFVNVLMSCQQTYSSNEKISQADTFNTKYAIFTNVQNYSYSTYEFNDIIEVVKIVGSNGEDFEMCVIPYVVPSDFLFESELFMSFNYLHKNKYLTRYFDDFCDTANWCVSDNGWTYKIHQRIDNGFLSLNSSLEKPYSVSTYIISNDSIHKFNFSFRLKDLSGNSENLRNQFLTNYVDSLNRTCLDKKRSSDFPVRSICVDTLNHKLLLNGDFVETENVESEERVKYFFKTFSFLINNNPFLSLSLYYMDGNHLKPYVIVLNNKSGLVEQYSIEELFKQFEYIYWYSRVEE